MRTLVTAVILMFAVPAHAQFAPTSRPGGERWSRSDGLDRRSSSPPIGQQIGEIDRRIDDGRDSRTLTKRQARRLRREAGQIGTLQERYALDGLSAAEERELDLRAGVLREQVNNERLRSMTRSR